MNSNEPERTDPQAGGDAAVASAGEPHGSVDSERPQAESRSADRPSAEELDAREEHFTRPRKAMGPTTEIPETVPEEIETDDE